MLAARPLILLLCALHTAALAQQAAINVNAELLQAARRGNEATVRTLLDQGAVLDSRNRLGDTPLNIAAKNGHTRLGLLLIERGADVNQKDLAGVTPLMSAAYNGNLELTQALLQRKADLAPVDRMKKNAVLYAAANGHAQVLGALLDHGADVNARYDNDLTALMWAAGFGQDEVVTLLLARGADRDLRDNRGKTSAAIAEEEGRQSTAALLTKTVPLSPSASERASGMPSTHASTLKPAGTLSVLTGSSLAARPVMCGANGCSVDSAIAGGLPPCQDGAGSAAGLSCASAGAAKATAASVATSFMGILLWEPLLNHFWAPARSNAAVDWRPSSSAIAAAVLPRLSRKSRSAPRASRSVTTSSWPKPAAHMRAVRSLS